MSVIGEWGRRIWYLLNRRRLDEQLRLEMDAHRAQMGSAGRFGNTLRLRERSRDVWGWQWIDNLARDIKLALRALRRSRGFAATSVISLALGLALATTSVAVVNAYLIRAWPYADVDRLYHVRYAPPGPWEPSGMSGLDWRSVADVVEHPVTAVSATFYLTDGTHAHAAQAQRVGTGFVPGLGVRVVLGRTLGDDDFRAGSERVVLVGHALWLTRYGGDSSVIGRVVRAEFDDGGNESMRIVGVLAPDFHFGRAGQALDLVIPLSARARTYTVRLRAGVPPAVAERRLTAAARAVSTDIPPDWTGVELESVHERYVGSIRPILVGITIATGLVLLIVCANVAVLALLRGLRRTKELAVRVALGSGRAHIARMLFLESGLISAAALLIAVGITGAALGVIAPLVESQLGRPAPRGTDAIALDTTVLLMIGAATLVIAVALSFVPLLAPWHRRVADALRRASAAATEGRGARHVRSALVAIEVAGTVVLLVVCASTVQSTIAMVRSELGFAPKGLLRARVVLRPRDYPAGDFARFHEQFRTQGSAVLGAPIVYSNWPPFAEFPTQLVERADGGSERTSAGAIRVGAGYFATLGIAIRDGRDVRASDGAGSAQVAFVSESLARRLWPEGGAVGRQVRTIEETAGGEPPPGPWRTVAGVVADVRQTYPDAQRADIYVPIDVAGSGRFGSFYVRTAQPIAAVSTALRELATDLDAGAIVDLPRAVSDENAELAGTRFITGMLTVFAGVAVFLAMLGMYAVTAYAVQQRERELAIRVALGATHRALTRLFLRDGGVVIALGLVAGVAGALFAGRMLEARLPSVQTPASLAAAAAVIVIAGTLAIGGPVRRASVRQPASLLKNE